VSAIARRSGVGAREPPSSAGGSRIPSRVTSGQGFGGPGNGNWARRSWCGLRPAGAGLPLIQEGHAGAEDVNGEGAAEGLGGRLGSFSCGAGRGDHQRTDRPGAVPSVLWARRGPARTGVLACLVAFAWVIPGVGQKSSIAENIAGKKHGAWPDWRSPGRFPAHLQAATGEWIGYTAVAESFLARGRCGLAVAAWTVGKTPKCWRNPVMCSPRSTCGETAARRRNPPRSLARRPVPISTARPLASQWLTLDRSMTSRLEPGLSRPRSCCSSAYTGSKKLAICF
jgi:hypothetical protein